jgi:phage recombination protein Bet
MSTQLTVAPVRDVFNPLSAEYRKNLKLFTNAAGRGLVGSEIDEAVAMCRALGANPFKRQIYFFVFDADRPTRRVSPVLSIEFYRKRANDTECYRPDDKPARFTYREELKGPENPKGIETCEVTVYKFVQGAWWPTTERLRWEERAPIRETGSEGEQWEPTGEVYPPGHAKAGKPKYRKVVQGKKIRALDPQKTNWHNMPETMFAKCVEASALRKAFPDDLGGTYADGETDIEDSRIIDLTAKEILDEDEQKERLAKAGAAGERLTFDWMDGTPLEDVPLGQAYDRCASWIRQNKAKAAEWAKHNSPTLRKFWAYDKDAVTLLRADVDLASKASQPAGGDTSPSSPAGAPQAEKRRTK